jgi:5-methylcytosine-specific restriction endonuclease McrA
VEKRCLWCGNSLPFRRRRWCSPICYQSITRVSSWHDLRLYVLLRDNYTCKCGAEAREVDHIIPISQGGTDNPKNLRSACVKCHVIYGYEQRALLKGLITELKL